MRHDLAIWTCGAFSGWFCLFGLLGAPWWLTIGSAVLAIGGLAVAIEIPEETEY